MYDMEAHVDPRRSTRSILSRAMVFELITHFQIHGHDFIMPAMNREERHNMKKERKMSWVFFFIIVVAFVFILPQACGKGGVLR